MVIPNRVDKELNRYKRMLRIPSCEQNTGIKLSSESCAKSK